MRHREYVDRLKSCNGGARLSLLFVLGVLWVSVRVNFYFISAYLCCVTTQDRGGATNCLYNSAHKTDFIHVFVHEWCTDDEWGGWGWFHEVVHAELFVAESDSKGNDPEQLERPSICVTELK